MAFSWCKCCEDPSNREFTVLLVHVLSISHPSITAGTAEYAKELVINFFRNHTTYSPDIVETHARKFLGLTAESRIEIAFEGRPRNYRAPYYKVYKYERSEGLVAFFEVEVRIVERYIPPNVDYDQVEIERTDYLPMIGSTNIGDTRDMRISVRD